MGVALVGIALGSIGEPLATPAAPLGIVSFEFSGDAPRSAAILDSWDARAREHAMLSLGLDYLFLVLYPLWLGLALDALGDRLAGRAGTDSFGRLLRRSSPWVYAAAPLDAIENLALIRMLQTGPSAGWAQTAWLCAVPKFALVGVALVLLVGGSVLLSMRRRPTEQELP